MSPWLSIRLAVLFLCMWSSESEVFVFQQMVLQTSFCSLSPVLLQPPQWGAVPAVRVVSPGPRGTTGVEDRAGAGSRLREPTPLSSGFLGGSWKRVSAAAPGPRAVPREGRQISGSQCCVCCRLLRPCVGWGAGSARHLWSPPSPPCLPAPPITPTSAASSPPRISGSRDLGSRRGSFVGGQTSR